MVVSVKTTRDVLKIFQEYLDDSQILEMFDKLLTIEGNFSFKKSITKLYDIVNGLWIEFMGE